MNIDLNTEAIILKYLNREKLDKAEVKKLEDCYLERLKNIRIDIEKNTQLDILKIEKIVTLVSLAKVSDIRYEEMPIFKSLEIFPKIKEVFLLYTKEAESNYTKIKEKLEKRKITVIGKKIVNELQSVYSYLREIAIKQEIQENNTVLDITLGMKILGAAIYKIAVERGIKVINWKEEFTKETLARNPFETTLEIVQEPIRESLKNRENINKCLRTANYSILSDYYRNLGKTDYADLFEQIDKTFNFYTLLNFEINEYKDLKEIKERLYKLVTFYIDRKFDKDIEIKISKVMVFFIFLLRELELETSEKFSKLNKMIQVIENRKILPISIIEEIMYYVPQLKEKTNEEKGNQEAISELKVVEEINEEFINENISDDKKINDDIKNIFVYMIFKFIKMKTLYYGADTSFLSQLSFSYMDGNDYDDINQLINDFVENNFLNDVKNILNFEDSFIENSTYQIKVENSILKIEKFDMEIDLYEVASFKDSKGKKEKRKLKIEPSFLVDVINSVNMRKNKTETVMFYIKDSEKQSVIEEFVKNPYAKEFENIKIDKNKSILKATREVLNKLVKERMKEKNKANNQDFIVEYDFKGNLYGLKVNEYYYNLD